MSWKKANEGGGIVWCHDTGSTCHTSSLETRSGPEFISKPFAFVEEKSPFFDAALEELAEKLNIIVGETQAREKENQSKGSKLQIGFLRTGAGYLPVWKREVLDSERLEDLVDVGNLTDLDDMTIEQRDAYLQVKRDDANAGAWYKCIFVGGAIYCVQGGFSCFATRARAQARSRRPVKGKTSGSGRMITYFAEVHHGSPVYDAALATLSSKMNARVSEIEAKEIQGRNKDPQLQIGFVATGAGFLPVWKRVLADTERLEEIVDAETLTHLDALTSEQLDPHLGVKTSGA